MNNPVTECPGFDPNFDPEALAQSKTIRRVTLERAIQHVDGDRNLQYGNPQESMAGIADLWNVYLGLRETDKNLDGYDVAMLLALLKVARAIRRPNNLDSLEDLAGYAGIAAEFLQSRIPRPMPASVD